MFFSTRSIVLFIILIFIDDTASSEDTGKVSEVIISGKKPKPDFDENEFRIIDDTVTEEQIKEYLKLFGYYPNTTSNNEFAIQEVDEKGLLKESLKRFQKFLGLEETGEMDNETIKKMKKPRCGVPDINQFSIRSGTSKWNKTSLTYKIINTADGLPPQIISIAIQKAFNIWSEVIPLDFRQVSFLEPDFTIRFAKRAHGDSMSFDGRGNTLAHASFPPNGMIHFDDDEYWAYMDNEAIESEEYTDILNTAIHEIGHAIGIDHIEAKPEAIMAPFYRYTRDAFGNYIPPKLTTFDIAAAQAIYGARKLKTDDEDDNGYNPPSNACPLGRNVCPKDHMCRDLDKDGKYDECYATWTWCPDNGWCPGVAKCYDSNNDGITDKCSNKWTDCPDGGYCLGRARCYDSDGDGVTDKCTKNWVDCPDNTFCVGEKKCCKNWSDSKYNCVAKHKSCI